MAELIEEQRNHALRAKAGGNLIRIISGTPGAPDYVFFKKCKYSFVVINYPEFFVVIDIDDLLVEKTASLSALRARQIAIHIVE